MNGCHVKPEQFFNLIFGYYDRYAQDVSWILTAASGSKFSTPVPAGEVWVINTASMRNMTGAATDFNIRLYLGASMGPTIAQASGVAQYVPMYWNGQIVLKEGDKVYFGVDSGAIGESIWAHVWGYKMKLSQ